MLYLISIDTESLTGPEAIKRAVSQFLEQFNRKLGIRTDENQFDDCDLKRTASTRQSKKKKKEKQLDRFNEDGVESAPIRPVAHQIDPDINGIVVYFKVSSKGIALTDNSHR